MITITMTCIQTVLF